MAKAELTQAIAELGLSIKAEFVPYSKSRSFDPKADVSKRNLNWKVTLTRALPSPEPVHPTGPFTVLTTDYSAGIAHCPSYKQGRMTIDMADALAREVETGKAAKLFGSLGIYTGKTPILPDTIGVIWSLVSDADVLNYSTFESWASEMGYDPDSRSAEKMYRACLEIALALRNGIGDEGMRKLQTAAEDY